MKNEVRKPPRPSVRRMIAIRAQIGNWNEMAFSNEELYRICEDLLAELDHKEILPGDDSIRVSREDWESLWNNITALIPTSKAAKIIERIERENTPKQDEGK